MQDMGGYCTSTCFSKIHHTSRSKTRDAWHRRKRLWLVCHVFFHHLGPKYRRLSMGIIRIMPFLALKSKLFYNLTYTGHYIPYLYCRIGNHWPQVIHSPPISSKELGTSKRTTSPKSYILVKSKESIIFRVNIKVYKCAFSQYNWNNIWFALGEIAWNCHTCDYPSKTMVSTS